MKNLIIWRLVFVMLAVVSLASCGSDDVEKRLTSEQRELYAQNISGEYPGQYVIIYKNKDCIEGTDEAGRPMTIAHSETFDGVQVDVSDRKVVDADEELSHALAEISPQAITARYGFDYDTDYSHIKWAFIPNVMLLNLNYDGSEHHIRLVFNNNNQHYKFTQDELKHPKAFSSLAENGITLQLEAIYDGSTLIQRFGSESGNYMHIKFKAD